MILPIVMLLAIMLGIDFDLNINKKDTVVKNKLKNIESVDSIQNNQYKYTITEYNYITTEKYIQSMILKHQDIIP